ncbi:MAG: hypothetical protein ACRDV9_13515, partial [Acidimicrobiia bacterium]
VSPGSSPFSTSAPTDGPDGEGAEPSAPPSDDDIDPGFSEPDEAADADDDASEHAESDVPPQGSDEVAILAHRVSTGRSLLGLLFGLGVVAAVVGTAGLRVVEGVRDRTRRRRER